ncbi:MAG: hypothetical protein U0990_03555 [Candidatus Nanopelagicales bacterium]|nr:hypothetical protein [Candidatus Nanopelagicales bacterium]MDZ4249150.1 hypothetical protein [Candidatus Nanopelagicales bacterium]MDZ7577490.1 hypothetical protein [Candidatus Nanopelagicales bacterium]
MSGKRRALPDLPTMQDSLLKRAVPAAKTAEDNRTVYFQLSLFSAEKDRLEQRLRDLRSKQENILGRLKTVDGQIKKLQASLSSAPGSAGREGLAGTWRAWNEVDIEY